MPCLLGIETSGDLCSVAIGAEEPIFEKSIHMPYGQAGCLMGLIQQVLTHSQKTWKNLTGVVINRGPGSFTGIRVGLSAAEGVSLAGDIPLFGLTGFDIYRNIGGEENNLLVLIDTRREDCFAAFFKAKALVPDFAKVMSYQEIDLFSKSQEGLKIIGNCNDSQFDQKLEKSLLKADDLLQAFCFYKHREGSIFPHDPYYLRGPEINGH